MHQALYRKWRPQSFADVVGQTAITDTLAKQIELGKTSHAYLFAGSRGTGKTTCAKIFAKAINCENPFHGNPCNECPSCRGITSGEILDIVEIDAASNNGVDYVRELRDEAIYSPASVKKRVYIVDEVHMFSVSAFNAILKIMEEPPPHVVFILATTELHKIPATIASRCQRFTFKRISASVIADRLKFVAKNEGAELSDEAASYIGSLADGAMRDALSMLDQCISVGDGNVTADTIENVVGLAGRRETLDLAYAIADRKTGEALTVLNDIYMNGRNITSVLGELCEIFRDVLITKATGGETLRTISVRYSSEEIQSFCDKIDNIRLCNIIEALQETINSIGSSSNKRIDAELCCVRLCEGSDKADTAALSSRIGELENKIKNGNFVSAPVAAPAPTAAAPAEPKKRAPSVAPAPKPASAPSAGADATALWQKVLATARAELSPGIAPLFSSVKALFEDGALVIFSENPFVMQMLTKSENTDILRRALQSVDPGVQLKASKQEKKQVQETSGLDELLSGLGDMEGLTIKE